MKKCSVCDHYTLEDSGRGYEKCYRDGCTARVYPDTSISYLVEVDDKVVRIKKYQTGEEKIMKVYKK